MASVSKETESTEFVYLTKYYSFGSSPIRTKNSSSEQAEVEFREINDDKKVLNGGECVNHTVNPYTEVWFRSVSGQKVTVVSEFGVCPNRFAFSEDTVDKDTREQIDALIKGAREARSKIMREASSGNTSS